MSLMRLSRPRIMASLAFETVLVVAVLAVLAVLNREPIFGDSEGAFRNFLAGVAVVLLMSVIGMRRVLLAGHPSLRREIAVLVAVSIGFGVLAVMATIAFFDSSLHLAALLLQGTLAVPITMMGWRFLATRFEVLDAYRERVLVIGADELARHTGRWIVEHLRSDYRLVGFADEDRSRVGDVVVMGSRIQVGFDGIAEFCSHRVDRLVVAMNEKRGKLPIRILMELRLRGIEIEDVTTFFERTSGKINVEGMFPSWLIFSDGFKTSALRRFQKRTMDIIASLLLLILTAPAMVLIALAIRIDSRGPIIYRQSRAGLNGRKFNILKFRSMREDAEKLSGPTWASHNDARVSRVGRVIRKLRLDELPQLFNVLRGEMSFVGPRPERPHFVAQLEKEIPYYFLRTVVRPGLTGWAQVRYGYGATVEDALEKLKYDLYYIKNCGFVLDLWIILSTVKVVLFSSGAR